MKNKLIYDSTIYCLDIETTTIGFTKNNEQCIYSTDMECWLKNNEYINRDLIERKVSFIYSFCITSIDFYLGTEKRCYFGRTYNELDKVLIEISNNTSFNSLIYIHNFSYENSFFINNLEFFKEIDFTQKYDFTSATQFLFLSANKPLFIRHKKLEFRCSQQLLSMSVAKLGKAINYKKLDYNYEKIRTPLTNLTKEEIEYNYRDCEIVLKYLYQKIIRLNEYIKTPSDLPLTRTSITRLNLRQNKDINKTIEYTSKDGKQRKTNLYNLWLLECERTKALDLEQIKFWDKKLFDGALVYSSPFVTSKVLYNIISADLVSDYPYQMDFRYYPFNFEKIESRKEYIFFKITKNLKIEDLVKNKIAQFYFNTQITIKNVKAKYNFYPFSTAKIENLSEFRNNYNIKFINGKLIEVEEEIKITCTIIGYIKLKEFYNFDLVSVDYLEVTKDLRRTHDFLLNAIHNLAKRKTEIKLLVDKVKENYKKDYNKNDINDDTIINILNNSNSHQEQIDDIKQMYLLVKGDLNAQYGNNAQHLLRKIIYYNNTEREYYSIEDNDEYFNNKQKTSYIYGLYIPQYAQATILYIAYQFIINNIDVLYIDTDSIKVEDSEKAREIINNYNNLIKSNNNVTTNLYDFGTLDIEFKAQKFCSLGSKTYILQKENKKEVEATISGLPNASKIYNEIFEQCNFNFERLVRKSYHYGVVFNESICKKLTSTYKYIESDVNIDGYTDTLISGAVLEKCQCSMKDFINNKTWYGYKYLLINNFNIPITNFRKTFISKNNNKYTFLEG